MLTFYKVEISFSRCRRKKTPVFPLLTPQRCTRSPVGSSFGEDTRDTVMNFQDGSRTPDVTTTFSLTKVTQRNKTKIFRHKVNGTRSVKRVSRTRCDFRTMNT